MIYYNIYVVLFPYKAPEMCQVFQVSLCDVLPRVSINNPFRGTREHAVIEYLIQIF